MQKRSQKSQSLRDRQRNHLSSARECEEEMQMLNKRWTREASEPCRKSRATVEKPQQSWKMRSRPCRQVKKEEVAVRLNPMDAALLQPYRNKSSLLEKHGQQVLFNSCSKSMSGSIELQTLRNSGQEEKRKEKFGKETGMMRRSKVGGAVDPGVDSDRCQDANGGSSGGGNPSTPRNGTHARDSSRSSRVKHGRMEEDGIL